MSSLLTWASPTREDRAEMPSFTCTPEKLVNRYHAGRWEQYHPARWEYDVQARIRECHPPCQRPNHALLGRDDDGIGAFVFWRELDGPAMVEILALAVAVRFRGHGGGWADEMMRVLFDSLTTNALDEGVDVVGARTWIDERNHGSQALCRRHGMVHTGKCMDADPKLQRWTTDILVAGAEIQIS